MKNLFFMYENIVMHCFYIQLIIRIREKNVRPEKSGNLIQGIL